MTAALEDLANMPDWPRRLSRVQAAAYVGVSPNYFDELVAFHKMPPAVPGYGSRKLWDRKLLDRALDAEVGLLKGLGSFDPIKEAVDAG